MSYKVKYRFLTYRISFIGYMFIKWVKGKQAIIQRKEFSWEISIQKRERHSTELKKTVK